MTQHHSESDSLGLRVAAIFVLAAASLVGTVVAPLILTIARCCVSGRRSAQEQREPPCPAATANNPQQPDLRQLHTKGNESAPRFDDEDDEPDADARAALVVKRVLRILSAFSVGIILGTSLLHLLPESQLFFDEALSSSSESGGNHTHSNSSSTMLQRRTDDPPFPFPFLVAVGSAVLLFILEQELHALLHWLNDTSEGNKKKQMQTLGEPSDPFAIAAPGEGTTAPPTSPLSGRQVVSIHSITTTGDDDEEQSSHAAVVDRNDNDDEHQRSAVTAHVVSAALCLHSIVLGLTIGLLRDAALIRALLIAMSIDQFSDGVAVGATLSHAASLSVCRQLALRLVFAFGCGVGTAIGLVVDQSGGTQNPLAQGILAAMSSGLLLLMAFTTLLPRLLDPLTHSEPSSIHTSSFAEEEEKHPCATAAVVRSTSPSILEPEEDDEEIPSGTTTHSSGDNLVTPPLCATTMSRRVRRRHHVEQVQVLGRASLYLCIATGLATMALLAAFGH